MLRRTEKDIAKLHYKRRWLFKSYEVICKEIHDRIVEYKGLQVEHDNDPKAVEELETVIHELVHLLEWANE